MAALRVALVTVALLAAAPATAAADPAATGDWRLGASDRILIFDLQLNGGGPVRFAAFELPTAVARATPNTAPPGTTCEPGQGAPATMRCSFGQGGWPQGTSITLTVDTDQPVRPDAVIPWRASEDGVTDVAQPRLVRRQQFANLTVEIYQSAEFVPLTPENLALRRADVGRLVVEAFVVIINQGPNESRGGLFTYRYPPGAAIPAGASRAFTGFFGAIPAGGSTQAGRFTYRIRPIGLRHESSVEVFGFDDPIAPDTAESAVQVTTPASRFGRRFRGRTRVPANAKLIFLGDAATAPPSGSAAQAFPPRFDQAAANALRRVEVAILRRTATGKCRWLRSRNGGFRRIERDDGRCNEGVWLRARGKEDWRLTLPRGLPAGRYDVFTRAVNGAGVSDTTFSARERNRATVVVRRQ